MRCTRCGAEAGDAPPVPAARCLGCGTLLAPDRARPAAPGARHSYATPYGRLVAQVQPSGSWAVATSLAAVDGRAEAAADLVRNLTAALEELDHPALPRARGFDDAKLRCTWLLPGSGGLVPLAALRPPLAPRHFKALLVALADPLARLHGAGLGAYDLAPSVVFATREPGRATVVPTPWLASLARWAPGRVAAMPFAAPELDRADRAHPDPARADVYALGALAWHLLTGEARAAGDAPLLSGRAADLAPWDEFIDGCCRSNPGRRFESVGAAVRALRDGTSPPRRPPPPAIRDVRGGPGPTRGDDLVDAAPGSRRGPRRSRRLLLMLAVLAALGAVLLAVKGRLAAVFPGAGDLLAPYRRGYGDTVLRYADRSYEGSAWVKLREADSLDSLTSYEDVTVKRLSHVAGLDDDSFWVSASSLKSGLVFRCREGHWSFRGLLKDCNPPVIRPWGEDRLLAACGDRRGRVYELTASGTVDHGESGECRQICPIAADLFYVHHWFKPGVLKVADGHRTEMEEGDYKYKEGYVHREDNTPLKDYPVSSVFYTRLPRPGEAVGIAESKFLDPPKVVAFRAGIWYATDDLPRSSILGAWFGGEGGAPRFVIVVGREGYVHVAHLGGPQLDQPVTAAQERTSLELIRAWGVGPEKYWVMDDSGTVWQRDGADSRVVVRGLYRDDVKFVDAWVSPRGTVIAITEKHVYRLD